MVQELRNIRGNKTCTKAFSHFLSQSTCDNVLQCGVTPSDTALGRLNLRGVMVLSYECVNRIVMHIGAYVYYTYIATCMFFLIKVSACVHYTNMACLLTNCCSTCLYTRVLLMCGKYLTVHSVTRAFVVYLIKYREISKSFLETLARTRV